MRGFCDMRTRRLLRAVRPSSEEAEEIELVDWSTREADAAATAAASAIRLRSERCFSHLRLAAMRRAQ